jgi:hypothetical protein
MYQTCLHCHSPLGSNQVIEHFPVGRRLAFDTAKGRLWVVCTRCRRWNLTPLEERWEAVEECEREFSRTRLRAQTENIGLARVAEGLDLVRVGKSRLSELAAWRYGESLHRRWLTRGLPIASLSVGAYGMQLLMNAHLIGALTGIGLIALIVSPVPLFSWWRSRLRIMLPDGRVVTVRHTNTQGAELEPDVERGWALRVSAKDTEARITGTSAVHSLRGLLTAVNFMGARRPAIHDAVGELAAAGDASKYIAKVAAIARANDAANVNLLPPEVRLALEMALHEESERRALEGELAELSEEWQLAEQIANIADNMFLPSAVLERLGRVERGEK